ncbi:MAG: hypothetical protein QOG42_1223 [Solirubrobacteraceae bacterium]|jgi:hypothetical protein|nr:hypothetical protein [Solirubrobacteraceae bacterium]
MVRPPDFAASDPWATLAASRKPPPPLEVVLMAQFKCRAYPLLIAAITVFAAAGAGFRIT